MNLLAKATRGKIGRAQKLTIYAPEGFGKSTLAGLMPDPLFFDLEGSTAQLDVSRIGRDVLPDLRTVESALGEVVKCKPCQTLVVDTIDWLDDMISAAVVAEAGNDKIKGIEDFGYGKGYIAVKERMALVLARFDAVIHAGINVVLLAHSKVAKFEPPDGQGAFDRYTLKLSKHVEPLIKEWSDAVLFGNYRTQIKETDSGKLKGIGGRERLLYATRCSAWDAKNRHGLADSEPWSIDTVRKAFVNVGAPWGAEQFVRMRDEEKPSAVSASAEPSAATSPEPAIDPDPLPGIGSNPDLVRIVQGIGEDKVTAYLQKNRKLTASQTWLDMPQDYADRVLKNPAGFIAAVGGAK